MKKSAEKQASQKIGKEPFQHLKLAANSQIGIVYRGRTKKAQTAAEKLVPWLNSKGFTIWTLPDQKVLTGTKLIKTPKELDKLSLVVVLGGDGTYLRAVRSLDGRRIPIIGFNMGSLGFLTIYNDEEINSVMGSVIRGEMELRPRSMLMAEVSRGKKALGKFHALNDIIIERGSNSQLIYTAISLGKLQVSEVKADGIIVSSPTGSTAYNLAAGGPIMYPAVKALVVTSVAPHSLTSRPLIVPEDQTLSFKLEGIGQKAHFVVDGQKQLEIVQNDVVRVQKSPYDHWVVRSPSHNYFSLLRDKLKFGDRS